MARGIACVLLAALAGLGAGTAAAQSAASGVNGYVTVATGYWNRGLAQNNDGIALQAGADYQHVSGFFVGGNVADVDYAVSNSREPREIEVDAYVGYHRRNTAWSWTLTAGRYLYPDAESRYEYTELAASIGFRDRVFFSTAYTDDLYSSRRSAWNSEVALTFPLAANFEVSAALGRFDLDLVSDTKFTHWNAGVSKVMRRVAVDLRYYHSTYEVATALGDPDADQFVLSVSYAFRGMRPPG
jgi:uncharacterized protein (TIGR02001 family)